MSANHQMCDRVKKLIVDSLRLKVSPEEIRDDAPLFPTLGLDSIDGLELVVAMEKEFGVSITSRDVDKRVFQNVDTMVEFIRANATKGV